MRDNILGMANIGGIAKLVQLIDECTKEMVLYRLFVGDVVVLELAVSLVLAT